jgi:hypothetical protein
MADARKLTRGQPAPGLATFVKKSTSRSALRSTIAPWEGKVRRKPAFLESDSGGQMKKVLIVTALLSLAVCSLESSAGNYYTLYGYKIGQELRLAKQRLGEPGKVFSFPDGWKAYAYLRDGHNVIFETDNTRPDLIMSIQLEGERNPSNMGLDGIDLGSDAKRAMQKLGPPTQRKQAEDLDSKKPIPNTFINHYGKSFSFEEKNNKVTSIKVIFGGAVETKALPDIDVFLGNIKAKNFYRLAESISSDLTVRGKKMIGGPIVNQISERTELHAFLFGKGGLGELASKDVADANLRVIAADRAKGTPGSTGVVYKVKDKQVHELYFVQSFEGWVLYDAW